MSATISVAYFDKLEQALEEKQKLKALSAGAEIIARIEKSPYGGFRLISLPIDLMLDSLEAKTPALGVPYLSQWAE